MSTASKDMATRQDIESLVNTFYEKVNTDPLLAPIFNQVAQVHWESHLPTMYDFWASMLLGDMSYQGNPFRKHIPLPIDQTHFTQWLLLFHNTVDELFLGPTAEEAKKRATGIAALFAHKLDTMRDRK